MKDNRTYTHSKLVYHNSTIENDSKTVTTDSQLNKSRSVSTNRLTGTVKLRIAPREIPDTLVTISTIY
jgi:hypothetical protein